LSITAKSIVGEIKYWFIYFTDWNLIITSIYFIGSLIITLFISKKYNKEYIPVYADQITLFNHPWFEKLNKIVNICFDISLVSNLCVFIVYWGILYSYHEHNESPNKQNHDYKILDTTSNIHVHAILMIIFYIDAILNVRCCKINDVIYVFLLGIIYIIWSIAFNFSSLTTEHGDTYIYWILRWKKEPGLSFAVSLIILLGSTITYLVFVYFNSIKLVKWMKKNYLYSGSFSLQTHINYDTAHFQI